MRASIGVASTENHMEEILTQTTAWKNLEDFMPRQMLRDSAYMMHQEQSNVEGQKVGRWLPGSVGVGEGGVRV